MSFVMHSNRLDTMPQHWLGCSSSALFARWVVVGLPYDGTTSNRPGTRFGPQAARLASWGLETYDPLFDRDLEDYPEWLHDGGDLNLPSGNRDACLAVMKAAATSILANGQHWLGVGGEHLVSLPVIEAYLEKYPDLAVLHFDAHTDLRDDYLGEKLSHATVLRRVEERLQGGMAHSLRQIGIRSGPRDEFELMQASGSLLKSVDELAQVRSAWGQRPVFITLDLDVLDPSILPGTGTPEPGGLTFRELSDWLLAIDRLNFNIVGADAVELSPDYDPSGVSSAVAAKVIRQLMIMTLPH
ncbi:MAG: agmatinase [Vampirovibrionales bacterium]|nr:agmatinase [Vampirovibrionales bacterium]